MRTSEVEADPVAAAHMAAGELHRLTGVAPDVAVVLGTGLAAAAEVLGQPDHRIGFGALPGFVAPTAPGHRGEARMVTVGRRRVLVLLGRCHLYEGRSPAQVAHPVRTAVAAGCRSVVLTNAAGGIRPGLAPGDLVVVADHLDLTGAPSALVGLEPVPFVDQSALWSPTLRALVQRLRPGLPEGVYAQTRGPQFETPAEVRMLGLLGADLVGMSTVPEALAAHHLGAAVLGMSVVTNAAVGTGAVPAAAEVAAVAAQSATVLGELLGELLAVAAAERGR